MGGNYAFDYGPYGNHGIMLDFASGSRTSKHVAPTTLQTPTQAVRFVTLNKPVDLTFKETFWFEVCRLDASMDLIVRAEPLRTRPKTTLPDFIVSPNRGFGNFSSTLHGSSWRTLPPDRTENLESRLRISKSDPALRTGPVSVGVYVDPTSYPVSADCDCAKGNVGAVTDCKGSDKCVADFKVTLQAVGSTT
jgi:hypothetical protein